MSAAVEPFTDDDGPARPAVSALPNGIKHPRKRAFLAAYAEVGNVSEAARVSGVHRLRHYEWLHADERYAEVFEQAHEIACDHLEAEARRRATQGWREPVFYQGQEVGSVQRYSDTLLIFLLKGARPDKFRDNATIRHTGPAGGAIQIEGDYALSQRLMADPTALAAAETLAALVLEDRALSAGAGEAIVVDSEEVEDE